MKNLLLTCLLAAAPAAAGQKARGTAGSPAAPKVEVLARAHQPGEALLVVVSGNHPDRLPVGTFGGRDLPFFRCGSDTFMALAGLDLEVSTGPRELELKLADPLAAESSHKQTIQVKPKAFPTRRLRVPPGYVELSPENEARAEREAARLNSLYNTVTMDRWFEGGFIMPVPGATQTSRFGERSVFNNQPRSPHSGADIKASTGTPILAPQGGKVAIAEDMFFQGGNLVLDHGFGLYSMYAHLSKMDVAAGRVVAKGEKIAEAGATGRVTGPHLHWSVKLGGARVDPVSLMWLPLETRLKGCPRP